MSEYYTSVGKNSRFFKSWLHFVKSKRIADYLAYAFYVVAVGILMQRFGLLATFALLLVFHPDTCKFIAITLYALFNRLWISVKTLFYQKRRLNSGGIND